ncbi:MAG: hypothetical protein DMG19_16680 [Acidobacteria bacterium]|nr:MAG: hypothetical protein DMG19_16680 [Acidobacteriota bacterium]
MACGSASIPICSAGVVKLQFDVSFPRNRTPTLISRSALATKSCSAGNVAKCPMQVETVSGTMPRADCVVITAALRSCISSVTSGDESENIAPLPAQITGRFASTILSTAGSNSASEGTRGGLAAVTIEGRLMTLAWKSIGISTLTGPAGGVMA